MALLANLQPEMPARRHCCAGAMYEEVEIEEGAVSKIHRMGGFEVGWIGIHLDSPPYSFTPQVGVSTDPGCRVAKHTYT